MSKKKKIKKKYLDQTSIYTNAKPLHFFPTGTFNLHEEDSTVLHEAVEEFTGRDWYLGKDHDPVEHPSHYTQQVPGVECKDVAGHFSFNVGSAMKYLWRHQSKGRPVEDLRKAIKFIQFEIERLERVGDDSSTIDGYTPEDED